MFYHPRLRDAHSPLTPIPHVSSTFNFSPDAISRCLEASRSTTPTVLKSRRSFTPETRDMSPPDISPIDFLANVSNSSAKHLFVSPCTANDANKSMQKSVKDSEDSEYILSSSSPSLNINNRHLNVSLILEDLELKEYKSLFAINEIDLIVFLTLNDDELQEIGIENELHREILLNAIGRFNGKNE